MNFEVRLASYCDQNTGPLPVYDDYGFIIDSDVLIVDPVNGNYIPEIVRHTVDISVDGTFVGSITSRATRAVKFSSELRVDKFIADFCKTDRQGYNLGGSPAPNTVNGTTSINTLQPVHKTDTFCPNKDNLHKIEFNFQVETQRTATSDVVIHSNAMIENSPDFVYGYQEFFYNGYFQVDENEEGRNPISYLLSSAFRRVLSPISPTINRKVIVGTSGLVNRSYWTVGVLNGVYDAGHSKIQDFQIETYNSNDVLQATYTGENNYDQFAVNTNNKFAREGLLYVGVGPANLIGAGIMTFANFNDIAYYKLFFRDNTGSQISFKYRYDIIDADCAGYRPIQLAYINSFGVWDYFIFVKKSVVSTEIQKSNFELNNRHNDKIHLAFSPFGSNYNNMDGGVKSFAVSSTDTLIANSDFMTSQEAFHLKELFVSPEVHMYEYRDDEHHDGSFGHKWIPVLVEEKEYTHKTVSNDKLIQYEIAIKFSHKNRSQGL